MRMRKNRFGLGFPPSVRRSRPGLTRVRFFSPLTVVRGVHGFLQRRREFPGRVRGGVGRLPAEDGVREGQRRKRVKRQPFPRDRGHVREVHEIPRPTRRRQRVAHRAKPRVIFLAERALMRGVARDLSRGFREVKTNAHHVSRIAAVDVAERVDATKTVLGVRGVLLRVVFRFDFSPGDRRDYLGFRLRRTRSLGPIGPLDP